MFYLFIFLLRYGEGSDLDTSSISPEMVFPLILPRV
jgi:hypothetical protein